MRTSKILLITLVAAFALTVAGCGSIVESVTERVVGGALSDEDTDVEVDFSDGGVSVSGEDGDVDIDMGEDGITVTGDDGEQSEMRIDGDTGDVSIEAEDGEFQMSSGGEIPDELPDAFPVPDDAEVVQQQTMSSEEGREVVVVLAVPGDFATVADEIEDGLTSGGFEIDESERGEVVADGQQMRFLAVSGHGYDDGVVSINAGDEDGVLVNVGLRAEQ